MKHIGFLFFCLIGLSACNHSTNSSQGPSSAAPDAQHTPTNTSGTTTNPVSPEVLDGFTSATLDDVIDHIEIVMSEYRVGNASLNVAQSSSLISTELSTTIELQFRRIEHTVSDSVGFETIAERSTILDDGNGSGRNVENAFDLAETRVLAFSGTKIRRSLLQQLYSNLSTHCSIESAKDIKLVFSLWLDGPFLKGNHVVTGAYATVTLGELLSKESVQLDLNGSDDSFDPEVHAHIQVRLFKKVSPN